LFVILNFTMKNEKTQTQNQNRKLKFLSNEVSQIQLSPLSKGLEFGDVIFTLHDVV